MLRPDDDIVVRNSENRAMAEVVDLAAVRRDRLGASKATLDPETAEVFPGVSLADLWRVWAHYQTPPEGSGATILEAKRCRADARPQLDRGA